MGTLGLAILGFHCATPDQGGKKHKQKVQTVGRRWKVMNYGFILI